MSAEKFSTMTLTGAQCDALIDELMQGGSVNDETRLVLIRALHTIHVLFKQIASRDITIRALRQMFQIKTEKIDKLLSDEPRNAPDELSSGDQSPNTEKIEESHEPENARKKKGEKKKRGHGRLGADAYTGATHRQYPHVSLHVGDRCPCCERGNLYDDTGPGFIRIVGSSPLQATRHIPQRLRCSTCKESFEASLPDEVSACKDEKYAPSAKTTIALLKYGLGFPFFRLERFQQWCGVPLPTSTQWDLIQHIARTVTPVYVALFTEAAQGDIIQNDDTSVRIRELPPPQETGHDEKRTGVFTTGLIAHCNNHEIVLYCSGRNHAGENLSDVLIHRESGLSPPLQVCDAAARNIPKHIVTIVVHCLVHSRRKFVGLLANFPEECRYVLEELAIVFHNEKKCRTHTISGQKRLLYHQQKSKPVMELLRRWMETQIDYNIIEENSELRGAINYMLNRWEQLTQFYRIIDAPLDSNPVERALKMVILNRKNAYFYKTIYGALVGDIFMSVIATCRHNNVDPFEYLNTVQEHALQVQLSPTNWLPWNYRQSLDMKNSA